MRFISGPNRGRLRGGIRSSRRASSLIELLVVISIIAILFGLLIPSLQRSIRQVRHTMCQNNLMRVNTGLHIYRVEHDGWLPVSAEVDESVIAQEEAPSSPDVWFLKLIPDYMNAPDHLSCPEDPFGNRIKQVRDLETEPEVENLASYGINSFIMNGGKGLLANVERFEPSRPGDTILLADLGPDQVERTVVHEMDPGALAPTRNKSLLAWGDGYDIFDGTSTPWITSRHNKGINVATLDGAIRHVRTQPILERRLSDYYQDCDSGGCTLCRELSLIHYTFQHRRLYWWTGALPELASSREGS